MKKYSSIMGFVFVALFALSCFTPISNATFERKDIGIYIYDYDYYLRDESDFSRENPRKICEGGHTIITIFIVNRGSTAVTLSNCRVEIYRVYPLLELQIAELNPINLDLTIKPNRYRRISFDFYAPEQKGLYKVDVTLDFYNIEDLPIPVYYETVPLEHWTELGANETLFTDNEPDYADPWERPDEGDARYFEPVNNTHPPT